MRGRRPFFAVLAILIISLGTGAGASERYIQAKITFETPNEMLSIKGLHLDIVWRGDHSVDIVTDATEIAELQQLGLKVDIIHDDLEKFYRDRIAAGDKDYINYLSLSQIEAELMFMQYLYPDLITDKISIGLTLEGRNIWAVKVSDNPDVDEDEPEILYTSAIHAREGITPLVLLTYITTLLENYGTDPEVTYLVDNREMWFVLVVNPDGYAYNDAQNPGGGGMWRKNRRDNGDGTFGVDLNRNYGYMWGYDDEGSSPVPDDPTYRGTGPFSEPETQAMRDFIIDHEFVITIYYHSYSNLIIWPFGYEYGLYTPDEHIFAAIGEEIKSYNGYTPGPGWILYTTNGDSDDWGYGEQTLKDKNIAITVEVGGYDDGFWPETYRIPDLIAENQATNFYLANAVGNINGVLPPEAPLLAVPDSVDAVTPFEVNWLHDDTLNPAVKYELYEMTGFKTITDPADNFDNWINSGFVQETYFTHSSPRSFWSGDASTMERYIQSITPYTVQPDDTLKFWAWYDIQTNFDFAYVEISTDGIHFTPIDGNLSTDGDPWWHNRGHGITGTSGDEPWMSEWVEGLYPLNDFAGEDIYVRFSYKDHSLYYAWYGFIVDDIHPVNSFETFTVLSSEITDTSYTIGGKSEGKYYYKVRAYDAEDQWGGYSEIQQVVVGNPIDYYCGDANGDLIIDILDINYLNSYIFNNGPAPEYTGQGDADNCGSINISDAAYIINYYFAGGPAPCQMTADCIQPAGGNSVSLGCPDTTVANKTVGIPIYITNETALTALSLGFSYSSGDISISAIDETGSIAPGDLFTVIDNANRQVQIGYSQILNDIPAQSGGLLATLMVDIPAGTSSQTIDFDSVFVGPAGEFIFSPNTGGTIYPAYNDCGTSEITIIDYVCGDPDASGAINILDITYIVSYLYKGGPAPDPVESADADNSGAINVLDITFIINYLYKGGSEPSC